MKKIDIEKIRGSWEESKEREYNIVDSNIPHKQMEFLRGDDTIKSIKMVAEKVNELIDALSNPL